MKKSTNSTAIKKEVNNNDFNLDDIINSFNFDDITERLSKGIDEIMEKYEKK